MAIGAFLVVGFATAFVFAAGRFGADVGAAIVLPLGAAVAAMMHERLYLRPLQPEPVGAASSGVIEPRAGEPA